MQTLETSMYLFKLFCYCYYALILPYNLFYLDSYTKYIDFVKKICFYYLKYNYYDSGFGLYIYVFSLSETSKLLKIISTSIRLYFLLSFNFISLTSFATFSIQALLAQANCYCQYQTRLLWLTRCVGRLCLIMAIAQCLILFGGLMTTLVFFRFTKLSIKRFRSLLAFAMTFLFLISIIVIRLLWYMIPFSRNWPSEIKLELHSRANIILCNGIVLPLDNKIKIMPIFFICITCPTMPIFFIYIICPTRIIKSMLLAYV